jgi:hypothetical protein
MDAATKRQVAKLGAGGDAAEVLASLRKRMVDAASADPIAEAIAARLEEVHAAREQLVQQLEAGSGDALWLLFRGSLRSAEPSPAVQRWKRVLRTLATSEELGPRATSALVAALHAGSGRTLRAKELTCKVLGAMATESKARAREAAAAGVFEHLAGLLGQQAGDRQEGVMRNAMFALFELVRDSSNRLQLAARQGALGPLAGLLGADQPLGVQESAAVVLAACLAPGALPDAALPPLWDWLLGDCVRRLAGLLARNREPISSVVARRNAAQAMYCIIIRAKDSQGRCEQVPCRPWCAWGWSGIRRRKHCL